MSDPGREGEYPTQATALLGVPSSVFDPCPAFGPSLPFFPYPMCRPPTPLPVRSPIHASCSISRCPSDVTSRTSSTHRELSRLCGGWSLPCSTLGEKTGWFFDKRCIPAAPSLAVEFHGLIVMSFSMFAVIERMCAATSASTPPKANAFVPPPLRKQTRSLAAGYD